MGEYSPTRALALEIDAADRHLEALADKSARQQQFLDEFDIDPAKPLPFEGERSMAPDATGEINVGSEMTSSELMAQLKKHRDKLQQPAEFSIIAAGPGLLHGKVEAARNLEVERGSCDPYVKVSYLPPPPPSDSPAVSIFDLDLKLD